MVAGFGDGGACGASPAGAAYLAREAATGAFSRADGGAATAQRHERDLVDQARPPSLSSCLSSLAAAGRVLPAVTGSCPAGQGG